VSKTPYVLRALKIIGQEEILKLSEVLLIKQKPLKKAAGEEFIVWDDAAEPPPSKVLQAEAKILPFPKKCINDLIPMQEEVPEEAIEKAVVEEVFTDLVLWHREFSKSTTGNSKLEASKGYKRSTEMYIVKTPDHAGKDKIRFASTNGVLINKKQA
jgi:hypothetical protein